MGLRGVRHPHAGLGDLHLAVRTQTFAFYYRNDGRRGAIGWAVSRRTPSRCLPDPFSVGQRLKNRVRIFPCTLDVRMAGGRSEALLTPNNVNGRDVPEACRTSEINNLVLGREVAVQSK